MSSRPRIRLPAAGLMLFIGCCLVSCDWNVSQFFFHPSTDQRMQDNLSESMPAPQPPEVNPDSFRFALFGDPQIATDLRSHLGWFRTEAARQGIEFFGVLGDLTDGQNDVEREVVKAGLDSTHRPYYCTLGNHDLYQADGWDWFKSEFGPSCYSVVVADRLKLIFLDTAEGDLGQVQFDWLEQQLAADTLPKVIGTHFPVYDGLTPIMWRLASSEERYKLMSLLRNHNVRAIVAGHIHGWRHTEIEGVEHFICALPASGMDYGSPGYLVFTWSRGELTWEHVATTLPPAP
jgi:hypothetical protein